MWYFMNKPIKHGGKYYLDVSHDRGDVYVVGCEVLNVSLETYLVLKFFYMNFIRCKEMKIIMNIQYRCQ